MPTKTIWFLGLLLLPWVVFAAPPGKTNLANSLDVSLLLGSPTDRSVSLKVIPSRELRVRVEYSPCDSSQATRTLPALASPDQPLRVDLENLAPSTCFTYTPFFQTEEGGDWLRGPTNEFYTARNPGEAFRFVVQADSHLWNKADRELYIQALQGMASKEPDLFFDLGDTFLNDKLPVPDLEHVQQVYRQQLPFLQLVAQSAPLFLVVGNHEGEQGASLDGTAENLAVFSTLCRNEFFCNPVPDGFSTGNSHPEPFVGLASNYYAFEWGDALFVVLDPYRYTDKPVGEARGWDWTLGEEQYRWLEQTLCQNRQKFTFVFLHHINGLARGGESVSSLFEWGGENPNGRRAFAANRPDWDMPIHDLLVQNQVTIVFQGHDHLFAMEQRDGVLYQTVPKPAERIPDHQDNLDAYPGEQVLLNSGWLNVEVSENHVQVDYNRLFVPGSPTCTATGVVHSYRVDASGQVQILESTDDSDAMRNYREFWEKHPNSSRKQSTAPTLPLSSALFAPSPTRVGVSTFLPSPGSYFYEVFSETGNLLYSTPSKQVASKGMQLDWLENLSPDAKFRYTLHFQRATEPSEAASLQGSFHTPRSPGKGFAFLVEADPHLDERSSQEVYASLLHNMLTKEADFLVDLGDNVMAEKLANTPLEIEQRFALLRSSWNILSNRLPVFSVLGNHDGEAAWNETGKDAISSQVAALRRVFFPNPVPTGDFYTGRNDWNYAWEWGDALFLVLNPFECTSKKPSDDPWDWTLGQEQFSWLEQTLHENERNWVFLFIHHLVGGKDASGRGGVEAAPFYEWGGKDPEASGAFAEHRPGWSMPIHELLCTYGVDIVFHGHDHFFAHQSLDGITYLLVPQPSLGNPQEIEHVAEEYGYRQGVFFPSPGYLHVWVSPEKVCVDLYSGTGDRLETSIVLQ
ncbi:MAG TPA: metallophosphoesterase [Thermotogota bacterium]|nr:metallophosphoesterase [Thermotogota bacterium]